MHYGLIAPELHGHLNPATTLAAELSRRGHRVSLLGTARGRSFAERAQIGWIPLQDEPASRSGWDELGKYSGLGALKFTGKLIQQSVAATLQEAPPLIRNHGIEALLVDQMSPAGAVVAEQLNLRYAVLCNAIAVHIDARVPPVPLNWPYRRGSLARLRNRAGNWVCRTLFDRFAGASGKGAISPLLLADTRRCFGQVMLAQQPEFFEFPEQIRPPHFVYTGPWHRPDRDAAVPFPWDRLDGRPLVYASMGTLQNKLQGVYRSIAAAARGLPLQMVLSLGGAELDLGRDLPENVIVVPFAPQLPLIEKATIVITHAGMNTALEALAAGRPMLCLPVTNDQPGIARRVEYLGAGLVLSPSRATPEKIRDRLIRLWKTPKFGAAAMRRGSEMKRLDGLAVAADHIESATLGSPSRNALAH